MLSNHVVFISPRRMSIKRDVQRLISYQMPSLICSWSNFCHPKELLDKHIVYRLLKQFLRKWGTISLLCTFLKSELLQCMVVVVFNILKICRHLLDWELVFKIVDFKSSLSSSTKNTTGLGISCHNVLTYLLITILISLLLLPLVMKK